MEGHQAQPRPRDYLNQGPRSDHLQAASRSSSFVAPSRSTSPHISITQPKHHPSRFHYPHHLLQQLPLFARVKISTVPPLISPLITATHCHNPQQAANSLTFASSQQAINPTQRSHPPRTSAIN
jgi:hypothetical protein